MKPTTRRLAIFMRNHRGQWLSGNRLFEVAGTRYGARLFEMAHDHGIAWEKRYVRGTRVPEYRVPLVDEQLRLEGIAS
ncbi:MAG: hypothetical protein LC798_21185 [Chloroflexi bacterium]|nr:hypothetical protein [Chloroflexota bacterium]